MAKLPLYLDYLATTPCDPAVVEAMLPYFSQEFGNAASQSHSFGWRAAEAVLEARERVAALIGAEPNEIVFTSGATESDNLGLKGVFERYRGKGDHIITCQTEHKAVLDSCEHISRLGGKVSFLPVDPTGLIRLEDLESTITPSTILICIMYGNNETGIIQPVREISRIARSKGILFMTDGTQALGKIPVNVQEDGIDLMAMSAHKIYGPKGTGALYVRRRDPRVSLTAQMDGGGHEEGFRSGTLNVPGIVGFGKACSLCTEKMESDGKRIQGLRDEFEKAALNSCKARVNGGAPRLPNVSNLAFEGVDGGKLLSQLAKKMAVSSGSACTSARPEPSHVLKAMGLPDALAKASIRFSFGRPTSKEDLEVAIQVLRNYLSSY